MDAPGLRSSPSSIPPHRSGSQRLSEARGAGRAVHQQEFCFGPVRAGDSIGVFSSSAKEWFEGEVVSNLDGDMVTVEYEARGTSFAKTVHMSSKQLAISNSGRDAAARSERKAGTITAGDTVQVFSNSNSVWFDSQVMELMESDMLRVEYEFNGSCRSKIVHMRSKHVKIPPFPTAKLYQEHDSRRFAGGGKVYEEKDPGRFFFGKKKLEEVHGTKQVRADPASKLHTALGNATIDDAAFAIFDNNQLYNHDGAGAECEAAWALKSCTETMKKDKLLKDVLPWIIGCVMKAGHSEPMKWTELCEDCLPQILKKSPFKLAPREDTPPGEFENQTWSAAKRVAEEAPLFRPGSCSPISAVGVIAADVQLLWAKLDKATRTLLHKCVTPPLASSSRASESDAQHVEQWRVCAAQGRSMFFQNTFSFAMVHVGIHHGEHNFAIAMIEKTARDTLLSEFSLAWTKMSTFYEFYNSFLEKDCKVHARRFLQLMADNRCFGEVALDSYLKNTKFEDPELATTFLIYLASAFRCNNSRMADAAPLAFLDSVLDKILEGASGSTEDMLESETAQKSIETVLLLTFGDHPYTWVVRVKGEGAERIDLARKLLQKTAAPHLSKLIDFATTAEQGGQTRYQYDEDFAEKVLALGTRKWMWKSDGFYFAQESMDLKRRPEDLLQIICMFFKFALALEGVQGLLQQFVQMLNRPVKVFGHIAPEGSAFHGAVAMDLQRGINNALPSHFLETLMDYAGFYCPSFQKLLAEEECLNSLRKGFPNRSEKVLTMVVKIISMEGCWGDIKVLEGTEEIVRICRGDAWCTKLFMKIVENILERDPKEFRRVADQGVQEGSTFTFAQVQACARRLGETSNGIRDTLSDRLNKDIDSLITSFLTFSPGAWMPLFDKLDTIIFFMKYAHLEDLDLAFKECKREIEEAETEWNEMTGKRDHLLSDILSCVQQVYTKPLVSMGEGVNFVELLDTDIKNVIMMGCAEGVIHASGPKGITFTQKDWRIVLEIAGTATAIMKARFGVMMLPHHTQMITLLMFAMTICAPPGGGLPQTMLARVGTGEGKSWIIGMLAAFVAMKGQRAHVVVDNEQLIERDFETMKPLFTALGLKTGRGTKVLEDQNTNVVYCSTSAIQQTCMDCLQNGRLTEYEAGLKNAVLIVDEVDGLIVDSDVYDCYVFDDLRASALIREYLKGGAAEPADEDLKLILSEVKKAQKEMQTKVEGEDYVRDGNDLYLLDNKTKKVKYNTYSLWLDLKKNQLDPSHNVQYNRVKAILCNVRCSTAYSRIFGLTGSLGRAPEKRYLEEHYDAVAFNVPPFLDTCRGVRGKRAPKQIAVEDAIQRDAKAQLEFVKELSSQKCREVPVLIIAESRAMVRELAQAIRSALPPEYRHDGVQELLPSLNDGGAFLRMVDLATKPLGVGCEGQAKGDKGTCGQSKKWRITVTTAEGGRGHDYRVTDAKVDAKGGMLVIIMWVPWSDREWTQFKGRTARQDNAGQYAVVLNSQDENMDNLRECEGRVIVQKMLEKGDKKISEILEAAGTSIRSGNLMHHFTGLYFEATDKSTIDKDWTNLCETFQNMSDQQIKEEGARLFGQSGYITPRDRRESSVRSEGSDDSEGEEQSDSQKSEDDQSRDESDSE